jgi:DNA-binding MarR family transcriptional regulator
MSEKDEMLYIIDLAKDELEFLILVTLAELESLSIKELIKLIDSSKATIYRKIGSLIEKKYIEIDPIKTAKHSGKYYTVTEKVNAILQHNPDSDIKEEEMIHQRIKENPQELAENLSIGMRSLNTFHLSLINIFKETALGNLEQLTQDMHDGYFTTSLLDLELKTKKEKDEVKALIREFVNKMMKYTSKKSNLTDNSYPLYISMFPLRRKDVFELLDKD